MNNPTYKKIVNAVGIGLLMLLPHILFGQNISQQLTDFNTQRININTKGMYVLAGWAVTNIAVGATGYFNNTGSRRYLHQMNAAWNIANLAIAGTALYQYANVDPASFNFSESLSEAQSIENILLLNMGLNVGYMATGGYLWERGIRKSSERLTGYGQSLLIQGGFLLLFDSTLYLLNSSNNQALQSIIEKVSINGAQLSISIPL